MVYCRLCTLWNDHCLITRIVVTMAVYHPISAMPSFQLTIATSPWISPWISSLFHHHIPWLSHDYPMIIPWLSHDYPMVFIPFPNLSQPFPTFPNLSPPPQAPLSACSSARCCSRFRASLRKVSWPLQRRCSSCFTCSWRPKNRWRFTDFVDDVQSRKNLKQNITSSYTMLYMMLYMMLYHVLYMLYW